MNAYEVLVLLQAAFPGFAEDDVRARLWLTYIDQAGSDAETCAKALIETKRFPPSLAEWLETLRTARQQRRLALATRALPAPQEPPLVSRAKFDQLIEACRRRLSRKPEEA